MKRIRILALLLACLMILPLSLFSCKKEGDAETGDSQGTVNTPSGGDGDAVLGIPADLNYGGEEFVVLGWGDEPSTYDFYNETVSEQSIQNAVYIRNDSVKNRLGINLKYELIPGNNANKASFITAVQNSVAAGSDSDYDLVACYSMCAVSLAVSNLLTEMSGLEYLDFEKPWWNASLMQNCKLDGGIYFCSGDLASSTMLQAFLVGVNMDTLAENTALEDPRELVKAGTWTYEKMFSMVKGLGVDMNDNDTKDVNDVYGLIASSNAMWDAFYIGSDMSYLSMDKQGNYDLSFEFESEKTFDLITYLNDKVITSRDTANIYDYKIFTRGDALFGMSELSFLMQNKSSINFTYSFVPAPKYDEEQDGYFTTLGFPFTFYAIPANASDADMTAAFLECMEYESNKQLRPAIYEATKYQQSNDEIDTEMFDTIIGGINYDLGRIVHGVFESLGGDGWKASPVMIFRRGVIYGENLYTSIIELEGPFSQGTQVLNGFTRS